MPRAIPPKGIVLKALNYAQKAHSGQKRASGEPYIEHPKAVAELLKKDIHADNETLAAALLHDTVEDTGVTIAELKRAFGPAIAHLVEGVTKIEHIEGALDPAAQDMASIRKIFKAMGSDLRVLFIKLADRLHNMQTLEFLSRERQIKIARETEEIFCPLASFLGLRLWYRQLSDLCFQILDPTRFKLLERRRENVERHQRVALDRWIDHLQTMLHKEAHLAISVTLRPRHLSGVHGSTRDQPGLLYHIETYYRILVITPSVDDCYRILGAIHQHAPALPGLVQDYISSPKINRYSALQTTVLSPSGVPITVVIQTQEMRDVAVWGVSLLYRKHSPKGAWRTLPDWIRSVISLEGTVQDTSAFFHALRADIFGDRCIVHPVGRRQKAINVPCHSSLLDVAYEIDPALAARATGVSVNAIPSNLRTIVQDGDVVKFTGNRSKVRSARDLILLHTSQGQKRLLKQLSNRPPKEIQKEGVAILHEALLLAIDPFFSTEWRREIAKRLSVAHAREAVGSGIQNPFDILEEHCTPGEIFLLDGHCFHGRSLGMPHHNMRFVLRTSVEILRAGRVIGVQVRPDVVDVVEQTPQQGHQTRELIPLELEKDGPLDMPFRFGLQWGYRDHSNPLEIIAHLQNLLDTPVELRAFDRGTVTLSFHTDTLMTLRIVHDFLTAHPDVVRIVRISP
ncbi:MAG: GTP pyrophosphokinase [Candidatus Peregrinibacteria bacterium Greene0416_62]|nr:MAG: GTP pyrophosphokinase [Candidatus Peregrinibacteria bacterium Greene0416_62]TSC98847.1 MAG: GTP pyrophosphokinase [Candidatus Peregrinibacteria bacterium Greene1014_49]